MPGSGPGREAKGKSSFRKKKKDVVIATSERQPSIVALTPQEIAAGAVPEDDTYAMTVLQDQVCIILFSQCLFIESWSST